MSWNNDQNLNRLTISNLCSVIAYLIAGNFVINVTFAMNRFLKVLFKKLFRIDAENLLNVFLI